MVIYIIGVILSKYEEGDTLKIAVIDCETPYFKTHPENLNWVKSLKTIIILTTTKLLIQ